jgi:hypothetical protein
LQDLFERAGFVDIEIKAKGGFWLSMANRFFDYCMLWLHSIGLGDLGFGYSMFGNKSFLQKILVFFSIIPAGLLFTVVLLFSFFFKFSDIAEDGSIHYVIAKKSNK